MIGKFFQKLDNFFPSSPPIPNNDVEIAVAEMDSAPGHTSTSAAPPSGITLAHLLTASMQLDWNSGNMLYKTGNS